MYFRFADFEIDIARHELRRAGTAVHIEPQVFDLLVHLIRNRDRIVGKDELFDVVWEGRIVSEATLSSRISAARRALRDNGNDQGLIRTVFKRGFRFVGDVAEVSAADAALLAAEPPAVPETPLVEAPPFQHLGPDPDPEQRADVAVAIRPAADPPALGDALSHTGRAADLVPAVAAPARRSSAQTPLLVAANLNIPVLDADAMGRAFPDLYMDTLSIYGTAGLPCALCDDAGNLTILPATRPTPGSALFSSQARSSPRNRPC